MSDLTKLTDAELLGATPEIAREDMGNALLGRISSRAFSCVSDIPIHELLMEAYRRSRARARIVEHTDFTSESA